MCTFKSCVAQENIWSLILKLWVEEMYKVAQLYLQMLKELKTGKKAMEKWKSEWVFTVCWGNDALQIDMETSLIGELTEKWELAQSWRWFDSNRGLDLRELIKLKWHYGLPEVLDGKTIVLFPEEW